MSEISKKLDEAINEMQKKAKDMDDLIQRTKDFSRMKISINGVLTKVSKSKGNLSNSDRFCLDEILRLYLQGRDAWLEGDLETVADMFGILTGPIGK